MQEVTRLSGGRRTSRTFAAVAITMVMAGAVFLTAGPAQAVAADDPPDGTTFVIPSGGGTVTPQLDPGTIALCNAGFGDVSVASWDIGIGHVDLLCGDSSSGYVHIRSNHEADWQAVVAGAGGGALWDDFMVFATEASLTAPSPGYPIDVGGQKLCYTTPVQIMNEDGVVVDTYHPTVVVSANNLRVITSYPTHLIDDC